MVQVVSVGELRDDLANWLDFVSRGGRVVIKNKKSKQVVAELVGRKRFSAKAYRAMLDRVAGSISAETHPEWTTKEDVETWLRRTRLEDERTF